LSNDQFNEYLFVFNCCLFCFLSVTKWIIKQLLNSACAGYQNYLDLGQCYLPQASTSADNIDLGLNNSGYPAQPRPIIDNNLQLLDEPSCYKVDCCILGSIMNGHYHPGFVMFVWICLHARNSGSLYYKTGPAVIGSINSAAVTLPLVLYMSVCLFIWFTYRGQANKWVQNFHFEILKQQITIILIIN
jgi:hypothetical protein